MHLFKFPLKYQTILLESSGSELVNEEYDDYFKRISLSRSYGLRQWPVPIQNYF
jgi:hypothetical protein